MVGKLQSALNAGRGQFVPDSEPVLAVDGDYGPMTAAVVRGAQKQGGIPVDGQVGLQTWALPVAEIASSLALSAGSSAWAAREGPGGYTLCCYRAANGALGQMGWCP